MIRRNMTNNEIYSIALALTESVANENLTLPIKVNFYLQKNITTVMAIAEDLEKSRNDLLSRYGKLDPEKGTYSFEEDKLETANKELTDLFNLTQEVPIYEISLEDFGDVQLTAQQIKAISYMIKDEEE